VLFLFVIPFLGMLVYFIARGEGMRDRAVREQADMRKHMDEYIRQTAGGSSSVDELAKLSDLRDKGAISDAEFEQAKAKLLA
jgi:putative oligomerization/nucleic acid binding protein